MAYGTIAVGIYLTEVPAATARAANDSNAIVRRVAGGTDAVAVVDSPSPLPPPPGLSHSIRRLCRYPDGCQTDRRRIHTNLIKLIHIILLI